MTSEDLSDQAQGTVLVVFASFVFATVALVVKVDPLPVLAATEARFMVCWIVAVLCMLWYKAERGLHWFGPPELRARLFLKCGLSFSFVTLWWASLRRAPIGNCISIIYCGPTMTSFWSVLVLGEQLPKAFPLQVVLVAAGVLLIVDPPFLHEPGKDHEGRHSDYRLVFAALVLNSLVPIVTRQTRACSWIEVEHVSASMAVFVLNPLLLVGHRVFYGELPSLPPAAFAEAGKIATAAMGAFVAVAMETRGYQLAEPGKAAMFRYAEVPFAYVLQSCFTGTPIGQLAAVGSVLIIASVFIGALEHRRTQASAENAAIKGDIQKALLDAKQTEKVEGA